MSELTSLTNEVTDVKALQSILQLNTVQSIKEFAPYIKQIKNPAILAGLIRHFEEVKRNDNNGHAHSTDSEGEVNSRGFIYERV